MATKKQTHKHENVKNPKNDIKNLILLLIEIFIKVSTLQLSFM